MDVPIAAINFRYWGYARLNRAIHEAASVDGRTSSAEPQTLVLAARLHCGRIGSKVI